LAENPPFEVNMADDSINKYQEILKQYRANQDMLTDMGLPESTEDPVQDMIDKANEESKDQKLIETKARLDEQKLKNSNNLTAEYNLDEDEEDRIMSNVENSVKTGSMGKADEETLKGLRESATPRENVVTPPVSSPAPEADPSAQPNYEQLLERVRALRTSDLSEAKKDRAMQESIADISEGIAKFGAGYAGGGLTQIKADTSMADLMRKRAARGYSEAEKGRKSEIEQAGMEIKAQQEAAKLKRQEKLDGVNAKYKQSLIDKMKGEGVADESLKDPASEASKRVQDMEIAAMKAQGIPVNEDEIRKLSGDFLSGKSYITGKRKMANELSYDRENRLRAKFGQTVNEQFEKDSRDALKDMRATDAWKTAEKTVSSIPTLSLILEDAYVNGGQSLSMLGPKIAKSIAGEVGVLTEQDVKRYVQNPQLAQAMIDDLKRISKGKLSEASYENLKRLLEISKKAAQQKIDTAIKRESILFSRRENIKYEDARQYLDAEYTRGSPVVAATEYDDLISKLAKKPSQKEVEKVTKRKVVRRAHNRQTNQTQFIYDDGSKEIVEGLK
jgi:hypothetical protein